MRSLLIALLVACGGDSASVHEPTACGPSWAGTGLTQCERACETQPANYAMDIEDMPCRATHPDVAPGITEGCTTTFEFEGERGCCMPNTFDTPIRFWQCQP